MPFVPTPNCVQAELIYEFQGQVCENVLHYVKESPWDTDTMAELAEQLKDAWVTYIKPQVSAQLYVTEIKITDLSSQTGPVVNYGTGLPVNGAQTGSPPLPNNVAIVFTKRTLLRGRSYRGRIYHCGLVESQVTANNVEATPLAALNAGWANFIGISLPVAGTEALLTVLSLVEDGNARTTGVATLVTSLTSDGVVDSQRRRLPRRGN